jgi:transketolase
VASPGDPIEAKSITTLSANYQGPMYLRLGKAGEKQVHTTSFDNMMIGDIVAVKHGSTGRSALLATGSILHYANEFISEKGIDTSLYSVPFIKPLNKQQIKELAQKHNNIIVLEEHQKSAGLGSAIIEQVSDMYASGEISVFPKIKRVAIDDCFYHLSGSQAFLRKNAGLVLHENMFE